MSRRRRNKKSQPKQPAKPRIFHSADRRNIVGVPLPPKPFHNQYKKPTAR